MHLILLSGGSGKRLWPLSNDAYSKQFLRILPAPDGMRESMLQRVMRQIREAGLGATVTIATGENQRDPICSQLGNDVNIVTEPERRDTFPAIALACIYLEKEKQCGRDEVVVVMPSDPYTEVEYFRAIDKMADAAAEQRSDLILMGIKPTYPSAKYGYIVPETEEEGAVRKVQRFTEKPDEERARELMEFGALWNGGVFAFKLGYLLDIVQNYIHVDSFAEARSRYAEFPKISFDYEVVEKASSVSVVPFVGLWKDLGTWDVLSEMLDTKIIGCGFVDDNSVNTHVVNRLDVPCLCVGASNLIVVTSPDGVLVADKGSCERIKSYVNQLDMRPMYEERRWGTYEVVNSFTARDGVHSLVKHICIQEGKNISYQQHFHRDEVWTFVEGSGRLVLDGEVKIVKSGDVVRIAKGQRHAVRADSELHFIEVQIGDRLEEGDIERFEWDWKD